jgi:TldD protein
MNAPASPIPHFEIAEQTLLKPHGLAPHQLERVFGQLFGNHVDYADLYFQYARSEAWSLEEGIVKSGSFNIEQGVGVRAISAARRPPSPIPTTSAWRRCRPPPAPRARLPPPAPSAWRRCCAAPSRRPALYAAGDPIASLDDAAKVKLLERLEAMARAADPRVREVMASVAGTWEVVLVARSDGGMAADVRPLVRVSITVIMEEKAGASRVPPAAADASTTPISAMPCCRTMPTAPCIRPASISPPSRLRPAR